MSISIRKTSRPTSQRNGRSIVTDINRLQRKTLTSALGFTEVQADRMMKVRRVLPLVDDRQKPCIDARKLWEKIGQPHGRFRDWAEDSIKPMMCPETFAGKSAKGYSDEITPFYEQTKGRPKTNYQLSRDVAAHVAMSARTREGHEIRQYFLDMEEAITRLERYQPIRTEHLTQIDNSVYHLAVSETGSKMHAQETERFLKGMVAEIVSGIRASEWRVALNEIPGAKGKGIRDVLDADDLKVYRDALQFAASLLQAGVTCREQIQSMVMRVHGGKINPAKYGVFSLVGEVA
ncbi:antA/AntB antirepressor family protein [Halomonas sp. BC04]|uniref:antA/AntB antirepressor family protein n=1 Tax=Halomonas sp. BC04 TaxID=1403540 RepID=UPI0003ED6589|nr:antA/AntB antirepressor family protein [Halomonas sp. BC04]EWH02531.1 hypothetical protein Q427_08175 [Halomonas sp. BC04]